MILKPITIRVLGLAMLSCLLAGPARALHFRLDLEPHAGAVLYEHADLDKFLQAQTNDNSASAGQGDSRLYGGSLTMLFDCSGNDGIVWLGPGVDFEATPDKALRGMGQNPATGTGYEVYFSAASFEFTFPIHVALNSARTVYAVLDPGFGMLGISGAAVSGTASAPSVREYWQANFATASHVAVGLNLRLVDALGLSFRVGDRFASSPAIYDVPKPFAEYEETIGRHGPVMNVDFGGWYAQAGVVFTFDSNLSEFWKSAARK